MNPTGQDISGPLSPALMLQHRLMAALGGLGAARAADQPVLEHWRDDSSGEV